MKLKEIEKSIKIISKKNIRDNINFDYIYIVKYMNNEKIRKNSKILFFPITISEESLNDGWYNVALDYRYKITEIVTKNPDFYYVIEEFMIDMMPENSKYIVVPNIMDTINILFTNKLKEFKGKTICVTGSVGKTTTVGFIEQVLKPKCLRIYSKRITPLILQHFVINFLSNEYDYFVIEAALWYKEHITYFSETLKPDLAILLNILPEHIGIKDIKELSDITKFKAKLFQYAKNIMVNKMNSEIAKLDIKNNQVYYNQELICNTSATNIIEVTSFNKNIDPYIETELSFLEKTIAYKVGEFYNIKPTIIKNRLNKAKTVEKRLTKEKIYNHEIIFDGDVSGVARLKELCNHYYLDSYLIIVNLTENGEEDENYQEIIPKFSNFSKVYINKKYQEYFKDINNVIYYSNLEFVKDLNKKAIVFMHYGSYYRTFDKFNLKNMGG